MERLDSYDSGQKPTCCSFMRQGFDLMKETVSPSGPVKTQMNKLEEVLQTRAMICHCVFTATRVLYPLLGIAYWQKGRENLEQLPKVNIDFLGAHLDSLQAVMIAWIAVGVLIDALSFAWWPITKAIFYYECTGLILNSFFPLDMGDFGELIMYAIMLIITIATYVQLRLCLLAIIATAATISFGVYPIVYSQELTQALVMYKLFTLVAILANTLVFMACITYVTSIKA